MMVFLQPNAIPPYAAAYFCVCRERNVQSVRYFSLSIYSADTNAVNGLDFTHGLYLTVKSFLCLGKLIFYFSFFFLLGVVSTAGVSVPLLCAPQAGAGDTRQTSPSGDIHWGEHGGTFEGSFCASYEGPELRHGGSWGDGAFVRASSHLAASECSWWHAGRARGVPAGSMLCPGARCVAAGAVPGLCPPALGGDFPAPA